MHALIIHQFHTNHTSASHTIFSSLSPQPRPEIVLLGSGAGYEEIASKYGLHLNPGVDMNFLKIPLAHSLVHAALNHPTEVAVLINSDILLTQSMVGSLRRASMQFRDWFMVGARHDISEFPSFLGKFSSSLHEPTFINYVRERGVLHTAGGVDFFAWNNFPGKRLIDGTMPPFIWAKSKCMWARYCCGVCVLVYV